MALAAALQEQQIDPGTIETSSELDLVPYESGGYRIPSVRVEMAVSGDRAQDELDRALQRAVDMCPICNALAGTDIQVKVHPAG
jgi:organic hydroperoxide reductase OsmC/OhrA